MKSRKKKHPKPTTNKNEPTRSKGFHNMQEKIIGAIASALNVDATELTAALKDGDKWLAEDSFSETLSEKVSEAVKAAKADQHKRAQREVWGLVEKEFKNAGFDNGEKLQGKALVTAFAQSNNVGDAPEGKAPAEFSREELVKLPVVKTLLQEREAKAAEKWAAEKKEFEAKMQAAEKTRKSLLLDKTLLASLEKGKINLGDTPEQKALRLNILKSQIDFSRIELGENDTLRYLDADGLTSDLEKEILPVAQTAFGVVTQDKNRGGGGANGSQGAGGSGAGEKYTPTYTFGDEAAFNKQFSAEVDPAKRATMRKDRQLELTKETAAG